MIPLPNSRPASAGPCGPACTAAESAPATPNAPKALRTPCNRERRERVSHAGPRRRGFTLLEVLVATAIMGIAVAGLMANLRTSLLNASKLSDYDRAAMLARRQMDELMLVRPLPKGMPIDGLFPPERMEGRRCGWRAVVTPFEGQGAPGTPPAPGTRILERIALQIWWMQGGQRRTLDIAAYRPAVATDADLQLFGTGMGMGAMR